MEGPTGSQGTSQPNKPKCCLGALYLSSTRYDNQKSPVCAGFAKRLRPSDEPSQLASESIPGGEFKYACLGYSAWDDEGLKRAARRRTSPTDAVQLPYCEGLEIVSSAAISGKPELLGIPNSSSSPQSRETASTTGPAVDGSGGSGQQRPGRSYFPGVSGGQVPSDMDWDQFKTRFDRISKKIIAKMEQNASFMGTTIKRSWEQIIKEVSGGGGGGGGGGMGSGSSGSPHPD